MNTPNDPNDAGGHHGSNNEPDQTPFNTPPGSGEPGGRDDVSGPGVADKPGGPGGPEKDGLDFDKASHTLAFLDAPTGPPIESTDDDRSFAGVIHLAGLAAFTGIPLGNVIAPLILWLVKREQSAFLKDQGKEALNFQVTVAIAAIALAIVLVVLVTITFGFGVFCAAPIGLVFVVLWVLAMARATMVATKGGVYRYKYCLRLIK